MAEATHALPGPKVLLMGPAGTGKTYSIGKLVDLGYQVHYVAIEAGLETLIGYFTDVSPTNPKPRPVPSNLTWHKMQGPKVSFRELAATAQKITTLSYESLGKMVDNNRHMYNLLEQINSALYNFTDDRTGKSFGPADEWDSSHVLVIDGLTGLSKAAMAAMTGGKPIRNPGDYGIAQTQIENLLRLICDHCQCWFVLISHVEKELDPVLGGMRTTVSTLGKALPPLIPPMFSDVVLTQREGTRWTWSTATTNVDTKARNLPWAENMAPDFAQIDKVWRSRVEAAASTAPTDVPAS